MILMRKFNLKRRINEKGLSLVEVLAAVVILSIVLITFLNFFVQSAKHTKFNNEKLTAVQVAEDVVAKVRENQFKAKRVGDIVTDNTYEGYDVSIKIEKGPTDVKLNKAVITVKSKLETGTKKSSFNTEMYYDASEATP
jgi:prepilin-type N-terminal cleavage/methylation domain-containing protein